MKAKAVKHADLQVLTDEFSETQSAFLVEFSGLSVVDVDDLRGKVRGASGSYRVVKNTLARKASEGTKLEAIADSFTGPTAVVLADEDAPGVAKALVDFAKANKAIKLKRGIVEGAPLSEEECKAIADIPSRETLIAQLAGVLQAPMSRLATVLNAPMRDLAVVVGQVAEKQGEGSGD
ncbi:MAG: 50S ribosomal protein L10 [Acidobacteriota bacterium]